MKKVVLFAVVGLLLFGHASVFAENFNTSDLEGTWYLFEMDVNPAAVPPAPPVFWMYGEIEADETGKVVSGSYQGPDPLAPPFTVTDGQMMLDKKGVLSGTVSVNIGGAPATVIIPHGKMDQSKTNAASVSLMTIDGSSDPPGMGVGSFIKGGGTFTQADLEGDWHGQGTMINVIPPGGVTAVSGTFNIDDLGNVSGFYTAPSGITATVVPAGSKLVVDGDGLVSGTVNLLIQPGAISVVSLIAQAKMDQNKRSATFVTWDVTDPNDPINTLVSLTSVNLVKGGGSFAGTELAGAWYTYSLAMDFSDITDPLIYWIRGQYQTDSSGNISNGYYVGPDRTQINATGGTMFLDNAGIISGNLTIEGEEAVTVNGKLDQGKTYGIFGSVDDTGWMNGMTTGVMIKDTYKFPWSTFFPAILNQE